MRYNPDIQDHNNLQGVKTGMSFRRYVFPLAGAALACASVLLTGCGGSSADASSTAAAAGKTPISVKTSSPQDAATKTSIPDGAPQIDQKNLTFMPNKLTVKVGDTVYFLNSDSVIHTIDVSGKNISGNMKPGQVVTWQFPKAGQYKISCDYHPAMNATITVQ
ncbi:MAG TPA: cupredoxin domain-containing protein [Tepidiformaceae bacterium]